MNSPGLYRPEYEHDNCGVGFVANIDGRRDHAIIEHGLSVLENLIHRGAVGGDGKTGDGAGMLVQLPDAFFRRVLALDRVRLPPQGEYGAGMLFVERTGDAASLGHKALALAAEELGLPWIGLRTVPTDPDCLGELALAGMPHILQFFVGLPSGVRPGDDFERDLYLMRRTAEKKMAAAGFGRNAWYVCSLSSRTIVYKGLFVGAQIRQFYPDLSAPDFASCLALVHQRYSTNTFPTWSLAQPFRFVAHNGEINTLRGNINKMRARENTMSSPLFGEDIERIRPVIDPDGSDSAVFDNVYELLTRSGRSIEHAMMMMIPEAFGVKYHISQDKRAFYEYHANFMEPWDGPAAMVFTDGIRIGATLDRNGLRPCRYTLTSDGFMVLASECGVLEIEPSRIIKKGRLMPGKMFVIDTVEGRLIDDNEIKSRISRQKPYRHWLDRNRIELKGLFGTPTSARPDQELLRTKQILHGYSYEQIEHVLRPMARDGQEPVSSMGTDASLAILSNEPQLLFNYFKQLFAQVTNPPIDPIREGLVMTLTSFIGRDRNLLDESPEHCRKLKLPHPILTNDDLARIKASTRSDFKAIVLPAVFPADGGDHALEQALKELCINAAQIVEQGADVLILSDRKADRDHAPIPSLLASAAVHHHLIKKGLRSQTGLIVESAEPREVMHFALLADTASTQSIPGWPSRPSHPWPIGEPSAMRSRTATKQSTITSPPSKKGFSRSFRRWGSPHSAPTRAPRFLKPSGWPPPWSNDISPTRPAGSAGSACARSNRRPWPATARPGRPIVSRNFSRLAANTGSGSRPKTISGPRRPSGICNWPSSTTTCPDTATTPTGSTNRKDTPAHCGDSSVSKRGTLFPLTKSNQPRPS